MDMWLSSGWRQSSDCAVSTLKSLSVGKTSTANVVVLISWDWHLIFKKNIHLKRLAVDSRIISSFLLLSSICALENGVSHICRSGSLTCTADPHWSRNIAEGISPPSSLASGEIQHQTESSGARWSCPGCPGDSQGLGSNTKPIPRALWKERRLRKLPK